MKKGLSIFGLCLISTFSFAQTFTTNLVSSGVTGAYCVQPADIDGDGDIDIVTAAHGSNEVAWFENTDGQGTFGTGSIVGNMITPVSIFPVDMDGDSDIDILAASNGGDAIYWSENTDGLGTFSAPQLVANGLDGARTVFAADINNDGWMDVICASYLDNKISYFQSSDGQGAFATPMTIASFVAGASSVVAADINGDGNLDILYTAFDNDQVVWSENTGSGTFNNPPNLISNVVDGVVIAVAYDLDGDSDLDVVATSSEGDVISWFENTDGAGTFGAEQVISNTCDRPFDVTAADLDGDGDLDLIAAIFLEDKISWFENTDGLGTFGTEEVITTTASDAIFVSTADINGDGNVDILSASYGDNTVEWYENSGVAGIEELTAGLKVYPNPASTIMNIHADDQIESVMIFDLFGSLVQQESTSSFSIEGLSSGIYMANVKTNAGIARVRFVKE